MIRTIPLNKLVASPSNVRRARDEQADLQLKADIEARGLLQNLVVTKAARKRDCFAVVAGERRRRALAALASDGKLEADHGICCFVVEGGAPAHEASLAENFQRLAMNPADECLAFQQLIDQGGDVEGIARRFGLTVRFVEGRLRLASLAPVVFAALGAGEISLEAAKAYASTPDQDRQAYVFGEMSRCYGSVHPDSIRRLMTQATASASDRRARLVGEDAYVAAGGRVERDLFADDAATRWLDIALLERLAAEKMEALAAEAAAETGLGWVRPVLEGWVSYAHSEGLHRVPVASPPLSDEEKARLEGLEAKVEDLAGLLEDEAIEESARIEAEGSLSRLRGEIDAIACRPPVIDAERKPKVGAFLVIDDDGRPRLDGAYYSEAASDRDDEGGETSPPDLAGSGPGAGLSQRLVDELAMQRRDILAAHVAADPGFALDLAIFLMIDRESGCSTMGSGSSLHAARPSDPIHDFKSTDPAVVARTEAMRSLDRSWAAGSSRAERFDAFRRLGDEARGDWLAHAVAGTLEASLNLAGRRECAFHDHLGSLLGIDVARWWRPTGTNFFDRVPKSVTLAALAEIGGEALAARYARAKKAELAQSCERIFSGDFIAEVEVKEAALGWVPEPMRFGTPTAPSLEDDPEAAEGAVGTEVDDASAVEPVSAASLGEAA